jgi:hypothetical protein
MAGLGEGPHRGLARPTGHQPDKVSGPRSDRGRGGGVGIARWLTGELALARRCSVDGEVQQAMGGPA